MNDKFEKLLSDARALKDAGITPKQVDAMTDAQFSLKASIFGVELLTPSELEAMRRTFSYIESK